MGMYTELSIAVNFKPDTPPAVVAAVFAMATHEDGFTPDTSIADHALFKTDRWRWMLQSSGSWYFDGPTYCKFLKEQDTWKLGVHTNIKNYSDEWECFVAFIAPHLATDEVPKFIGHYRYEEQDDPTLLYLHPDGTIEWETIGDAP